MGNLQLHFSTEPLDKNDFLRVYHNKGKIEVGLTIFKYTDKDTRQIVLYAPSLELTGYGETEDKAQEMLEFSLDELFEYLIKLSPKYLKSELSKLGFKQHFLRSKEYSKAYIDGNGELQNLAMDHKVERLAVTI